MKNDSAQSTTKEHIEQMAFALWKEKGIDYVSISDICEKASISRSTFYRHYKGEWEIVAEYLQKLSISNLDSLANAKSLTSKEILRGQLLAFRDNYEMISLIFYSAYRKLLSEILFSDLSIFEMGKLPYSPNDDYAECYVFGGFILVFMAWVAKGDDLEGNEVSLFLCKTLGINPDKKMSSEEIRAFSDKVRKMISVSSKVISKTSA